jgi:predicted transcriptional regulator
MVTRKVTVTLPEDVVAALTAAAEADGVPVSRMVSRAVETELQQRLAREVIAEWQRENGAFTPEETARVDAAVAAADEAAYRDMAAGSSARTVA